MQATGTYTSVITKARKLTFKEWCLGVLVSPITLLFEATLHLGISLFYAVGLLVNAPRLFAGLCVWIGLAIYIGLFGGKGAFSAARRHKHWGEQIVLDTEVKDGQLSLLWEV